MKLNFGSETVMIVFILGLAFFTVIQPTFYPSYSTIPSTTPTPPAGGPTPTPTPPGAGGNLAFFTINPPTNTVRQGETLTLSLTLNTGDYEIDAIQLKLNFDPQFLQATSIIPGTIFPQYTNQQVVNSQVRVYAAGEIKNGQVVGFKGTGEYAQIVFQVSTTIGSTQITFDQDCIAGGGGTNLNLLDLSKCQPGNYQITD